MKFSIAATLLILTIGGMLMWKHENRILTLQTDYRGLAEDAEKMGIPTGHADSGLTRRKRENRTNLATATAADLLAFAREIELHERTGDDMDEALERRGLDMQARLMALDAGQLKIVIAALRDDETLSRATRQNLIGVSITMLSEDQPAAALALFSESYNLLGGGMIGGQVVSSTLARWAKNDPAAAQEWVRKNAALHPEIADDTAKRAIVEGVAENNPELAFKLIGEMQIDDSTSAVMSLVEAGKTPEQRTAILDALRTYLATLPPAPAHVDLLQESLETMGRNLSNERFESVQSWLSNTKLTPAESAQFAAGLSYFNTKEDTGRWIEWMAEKLPADGVAQNVENLIGQWTQQDYQAAGKWLAAAPEGPAKAAAVSSYAGTVAEYEPQTAVQWALTLPAGEARQSTFEAIYQNWPKSDAAAAAAFAREHGVDTDAEP